jgi:hypothetical protein
MAGKCKICASPNRERVELRLLTGESIHSLSEWLKTQGETVSAPSIQRHKRNHFAATMHDDGKPPITVLENVKTSQTGDFEPFIDINNVLAKIQNDLDTQDVFSSVITERKFTQLLLEKIAQKQLIIVDVLQDQYVAGKAGYPDSQIRGLKTILDMANSLPTYKNDKLLDDIKADNVETIEQKIYDKTLENAANETLRYHEWYVVKQKPDPIPIAMIEKSASKLFADNQIKREKWIETVTMECHRKFSDNVPRDWHFETMINRAIEIVADETKCDKSLLEKRGLKALMARFNNPREATRDMKLVERVLTNTITS